MQKFILSSIDELEQVASNFISSYHQPAVFCFYGAMGAGKTTFIQALCQQLKVVDVVNSPTFAIVNEYDTEDNDKVYHFDFYRLKEQQEALDLGYEDYFYSDSYCFVEWPEKIDTLLPEHRFDVKITVLEDMTREIEVIEHK